jgi:hypothetical protein
MTYSPYKGLQSLQNQERPTNPKFNWDGYSRFFYDRYTIVDKNKKEVPFKQQAAQLDFLYHMSLYQNLLILKARKMGFSSTALAVAATKFLMGKNEKCVSMSFDQGASDKQLSRAKHYIRSYERITGTKVPLKYNSKSEMVWEGKDSDGNIFTNTLRVGTARSTSFGRGDDITFLHLTEVSFADDVDTLLAGVGEALVHGAHSILETTANGFNSYKRFWDEAILNKRGFAALFYSPEWEYDQAYLQDRESKLGRLYKQEYPMNPQEAFLTSGEGYFDSLALQDLLLRCTEPMIV